jgi:NADPH:quinone reductase-like Zn-dependent oxidoreductase
VVVRPRRRDLARLAGWIDLGAMAPVVDRVYPLAEVADAHAYVETKRARGKVVLRVSPAADDPARRATLDAG